MTKKEQYIALGVVLILGATAVIVVNRDKKKKQIKIINDILDAKSASSNSGQKVISKTDYDKLPAGNFPLKIKDKNKKVYDLQQALNRNYGTNLDLDGSFGQGLYKTLCDKYFNYGCTVLGVPVYTRTIEQTDFDTIKSHKN